MESQISPQAQTAAHAWGQKIENWRGTGAWTEPDLRRLDIAHVFRGTCFRGYFGLGGYFELGDSLTSGLLWFWEGGTMVWGIFFEITLVEEILCFRGYFGLGVTLCFVLEIYLVWFGGGSFGLGNTLLSKLLWFRGSFGLRVTLFFEMNLIWGILCFRGYCGFGRTLVWGILWSRGFSVSGDNFLITGGTFQRTEFGRTKVGGVNICSLSLNI